MIEDTEHDQSATRCEGGNHIDGAQGHDPEALAAWLVTMSCSSCSWEAEARLCTPRVRYIRAGSWTMTCPECDEQVPWQAMWTAVKRLETMPRIGRALPVTTPSAAAAPQLVQEFANYLESRRRAPGTVALRIRHIEKLAASFPVLATVTPEQLDAWVREQGEGLRPATVNSMIKSLRAFYRWADRFGVIRPDPTVLLDLVPNPHRMGRTVGDDELAAILPGVTPDVLAMLLLGRLAGLRLAEIATLHTSCREGDWLTIIGKGNKQRRVFAVPELGAALDAISPEGAGYYFPARVTASVERIGEAQWRVRSRAAEAFSAPPTFASRADAEAWLSIKLEGERGHLQPLSVHKIIKRAAGINPHALRHAAGTAVYRSSKDLRATQAFLGHSSPNTTAIYVHIEEDTLEAVTRAGALLR